MSDSADPSLSALARLVARETSLPVRLGHVALLLAAIAMATLLAALLATEPALPGHSRVALSLMLPVALGWTGYAAWVLAVRRPLFARHRVIAGWMALAFSLLFTTAMLAGGWAADRPALFAAAALGAPLIALATMLLVRARRQAMQLEAHRVELEAAIEGLRW